MIEALFQLPLVGSLDGAIHGHPVEGYGAILCVVSVKSLVTAAVCSTPFLCAFAML